MNAFDDHIAEVDADAKLHLPMFGQLGILLFECVLNLHRAAHGIDHTGELGQADCHPAHRPPGHGSVGSEKRLLHDKW